MAMYSVPTVPQGLAARQLWQAPVFLLGCAVLAAFLLARPLWNNPLTRAEARLDQARRLWEQHGAPPRKVLTLVQYYLDNAGPEPARAAEAYLIQGCTLVRAARKTAGEQSAALWQQAHQHLVQARALGLPEEERPKALAALGESGFHSGKDLGEVCANLSANLDAADDRSEACRALTLAFLKKEPPDLEGALNANERLRQQPLLGEDVLGPARLQGGDILLRLRRPAEARKLLEKIAADAAPDVFARARILRARSHQEESQWTEAAVLWQEALDNHQPPSDPGEVFYNLGLCHRRLEQRDEALEAWREGVKRGNSASAAACSLGVGELLLAAADLAAVESLTWAVRDVQPSAGWANPYLDLKQARGLFEQGGLVCRQKAAFEKALVLAEAYERLAEPGMAAHQRGLALREWGRALEQGTPPQKLKSVELLRQSGAAFELAAGAARKLEEQADRLWLSANGHLEGNDPARAVSAFERFLKLPGHAPERSGEGWYLLALAHERLKRQVDAEAAYRRSISYRGKFACRARFRLSEVELARGKTDDAIAMLAHNLALLRLDHDDEAMERSLYALGHELFKQRKYTEVRPVLEEGVTRYPRSGVCARGRFELAETYNELADLENQNWLQGGNLPAETREHFQKQKRHWRTLALEQFELLSQTIASDARAGASLTKTEQVEVPYKMAKCRFNLGDYAAALKLYDQLAERSQGRLEHLNALGGAARCYAAQRDFQQYRARLEDIRLALKDVDEETRREWEEWLSKAGKGQ